MSVYTLSQGSITKCVHDPCGLVNKRHAALCGAPGKIAMSNKLYKECKRIIVRGLLCLVGGSALLLVVKLPGLPEFWAVAGACILLYGNWCIIYGLLIFAGSREAE